MTIRDKNKAYAIKRRLLEQLKEEHALWSYDTTALTPETIGDEHLIAMTMRYLDLDEIRQIFMIYPKRKIKETWQRILVPEGDYLYTLNRFFAWYYFDAKRPDAYLKSLITRNINRTITKNA